MTANTGTFTYWRYGQPSTEFEESTTALDAGVALSAAVGGGGETLGSMLAGANALASTLDGTGGVGDLLTAGSALLETIYTGEGIMLADILPGAVIGRTATVSMRYGIPSWFIAPQTGHTGTFSYWRYDRPAEFRVTSGPVDAPSVAGQPRPGRWRFPLLKLLLR